MKRGENLWKACGRHCEREMLANARMLVAVSPNYPERYENISNKHKPFENWFLRSIVFGVVSRNISTFKTVNYKKFLRTEVQHVGDVDVEPCIRRRRTIINKNK